MLEVIQDRIRVGKLRTVLEKTSSLDVRNIHVHLTYTIKYKQGVIAPHTIVGNRETLIILNRDKELTFSPLQKAWKKY